MPLIVETYIMSLIVEDLHYVTDSRGLTLCH